MTNKDEALKITKVIRKLRWMVIKNRCDVRGWYFE